MTTRVRAPHSTRALVRALGRATRTRPLHPGAGLRGPGWGGEAVGAELRCAAGHPVQAPAIHVAPTRRG
jgi:hypothetical protein